MTFPTDLSNVKVLKIHPAIGIARVSRNRDYFVFGQPPAQYKSNGLMKRQAVQFRVFAYGENHQGLGELTPAVMSLLGVSAVWSASVANRKIAYVEGKPLSDTSSTILASASSDDASAGSLVGKLEGFEEGAAIPMGQITAEGMFIPPLARVFRRSLPGVPIPPYPQHTKLIADNTSDGSVAVTLSGPAASIPVLSACILVAPGDYAPDSFPAESPSESLVHCLRQELGIPMTYGGNPHNLAAERIDVEALRPATGDFAPGFEVSFGTSRGEVRQIVPLFLSAAVNPLVDPREMRIAYNDAPAAFGAVRGQLTSGLCSPWQTDFTACVSYWTENLPEIAYLDEDQNQLVSVYRREYADYDPVDMDGRLYRGDDFDLHQDKVGVVRIINGKEVETERDAGDDIPRS